jgi:3-hydroxybutyryl-CoA dehydrogenase
MTIQNITVIGAGTMGNGIAHVFAQYGFRVSLVDVSAERLSTALATIEKNLQRQASKGILTAEQVSNTLQHISTFDNLATGCSTADLVVEAATENEKLKADIFKQIDQIVPAGAILATNTSSISITKIAAQTSRPEKVIGMHFMNPVPVMKLVEVINGYKTAKETTAAIESLTLKIEKVPVAANDYPGFVANRILMPMINEAIISLNEGVAGVAEIDQIMKLGMAHPMGPLQLADFIGLDVCKAIMEVLYHGLGNPKYAPSPLLVNMVTAGNLGVKSGEGFYAYEGGKPVGVASKFA